MLTSTGAIDLSIIDVGDAEGNGRDLYHLTELGEKLLWILPMIVLIDKYFVQDVFVQVYIPRNNVLS